jgi:sortase B signal domain, QVPTGV class
MRKNLNRLATLALSGMMVMSMAVPAFAAKVEVPFKKTLHTDGNTYAPNATFKFDVVAKTGNITYNGKQYTGLTAAEGAVTVKDAVFTKDLGLGTADAQGASIQVPANIVVDEDKLTGGLGNYFFTMTERNEGYEGIRYSKAEYTIVVTKYEENGTVKTTTTVQREGKGLFETIKPGEIQNNYGKHFPPETPDFPDPNPNPGPNPDPDPNNDTTHDVTVKKRIKGGFANTSRSFNFAVTVESQDSKNERYKVEVLDKNGAVTETTFVDDRQGKNFSVSQDSGLRIYGLTKNDLVKVHETDGDDYVMTVSPDKDNTFIKNIVKPNNNFKTQFNVVKDKANFDVINTKEATTPTGIVMNVAPYAMMLAVAGGLGVVFMNRKKEEE